MESVFKDNLLEGKVALFTGGRGGILYGIAKTFLKHGCSVAIMSRDENNIFKAVENLKKDSNSLKCFGVKCDVRNFTEVEAAVDSVLKNFNKIDILINGAAGNFLATMDKLSARAFKTVIEIDTIGTFNVTKVVYSKYMKANGGNIINISASLYYCGTLLQAHSGSAKAAIDALTKHWAVEFGPKKIRVNGISPGPIDGTEGMDRLSTPQAKEEMSSMIPLQRLGSADDIAKSALFLASEASSYITGHTLVVDGGQWLSAGNFTLLSKEVQEVWKLGKL